MSLCILNLIMIISHSTNIYSRISSIVLNGKTVNLITRCFKLPISSRLMVEELVISKANVSDPSELGHELVAAE